MTYSPNIPLPTDIPSQSQSRIITNFSQLNAIFAVNHYEYDHATVAFRGKHKYVSFPNQAAGPATGATESALYAKVYGGQSALYWRMQGTGTEVLMTNSVAPSNNATGYSYLPGGMLIQWATAVNIPPSASTACVFGIPFSNIPHVIQCTLVKTAAGSSQAVNVVTGTVTVNGFRVWHSSSGLHDVYFIAIGPK